MSWTDFSIPKINIQLPALLINLFLQSKIFIIIFLFNYTENIKYEMHDNIYLNYLKFN